MLFGRHYWMAIKMFDEIVENPFSIYNSVHIDIPSIHLTL